MKLLLENWNFKEEKSKITNGYKISNHVIPFSFELITLLVLKLQMDIQFASWTDFLIVYHFNQNSNNVNLTHLHVMLNI